MNYIVYIFVNFTQETLALVELDFYMWNFSVVGTITTFSNQFLKDIKNSWKGLFLLDPQD